MQESMTSASASPRNAPNYLQSGTSCQVYFYVLSNPEWISLSLK